MEGEVEGRRVTRQAVRNVTSAVPPTIKRKRQSTGSTAKKGRRQRRSIHGDIIKTTDTPTDLKQESGSSGLGSMSDDEDLPSAELSSPAKITNSQTQIFKKHDIVWIKYRREQYRPCLITSVTKNQVRFKFIYGKKKDTYRTTIQKVIGFDDPVKNNELLSIGRKVNPHIVDAYERARLFFCRLSEQNNLSPLKYLFFDKTEDLLYGIVPEHEVENKDNMSAEKEENVTEEDEFDCPVSECSDNEEDDEDEQNKENNEQLKDEIFNDIYAKMTVTEKAKLLDNVKILLKSIASEDGFKYLKQIVEGTIESSRMTLLNDGKDLDLEMKSGGLGPFLGADQSETDELLHIINNHVQTLQFQGDSSLLTRHVLIPEAIIYSLHKEWNWSKDEAEAFFMEWTFRIPDWKPKETTPKRRAITA